jgi:hypothetical protein
MLGEEQWIAQRPKDAATVVSVVTSVVAGTAIVTDGADDGVLGTDGSLFRSAPARRRRTATVA